MADANGDGKIDKSDIDKVKSMIAAKADSPKQPIYYVDVDGALNKMHFPAKTIISTYEQNSKQLKTLGALDMVIGCEVASYADHTIYMSELKDKVMMDNKERRDPPAEKIIAKNPDIVVTGTRGYYSTKLEATLPADRTNMDVVRISSWEDNKVIEGTLTLGFMSLKSDVALEYAKWTDKYIGEIEKKTGKLIYDKKVKVLVPRGGTKFGFDGMMNSPRSGKYETSVLAGANNIITRQVTPTTTSNLKVTDEWVSAQTDLNYIVYVVYDGLKENTGDNRVFYNAAVDYWKNMTAACGTEIHVVDNEVMQGTTYVIGSVYMAKWFYPELFTDMNPDNIFQEFIDTFWKCNFNVAAHQAGGGIAI